MHTANQFGIAPVKDHLKAVLRSSGAVVHARLPAYALAVAVTLATLGAQLAVAPWFGDRPVLLLLAIPILFSAFLGGAGPGLAATGVVALGAVYFLLPPTYTRPVETPVEAVQWLILILSGVLISLLTKLRRHRAQNPADAAIPGMTPAAERTVLRSFALALGLLAVVGAIAILSVSRLREQSAWETHTHNVIGSLRQVLSLATDIETAARGYILTGQEDYLARSVTARAALPGQLQTLRTLTADNPDQQKHLAGLEPLVAGRLARADEMVALRRQRSLAAVQAAPDYGLGRELQDQIRAQVATMEAAEQGLLRDREDRTRRLSVTARTIVIGGGTLSFIFVALALVLMNREFKSRHRTETALHAAESDVSAGQQAQAALGLSHDGLERRVAQRTRELSDANRALLQANERTEAVLAGMSDIYFIIDRRWHYLYANEAALDSIQRTTAVPRDLVPSRTPWDLFPAIVGTELDRQLRRTMEERVAVDFEYYHAAPDLWWHYRAFPVAGGAAVFARDITAAKRAALATQDSEERFAGAFEHAPNGMALVAPDGRWLRVNRALCDLVGYTEAELLAGSFQQITHPADLAADLENVRQLLAGETRSYQMEKRFVHAQGDFLTVSLSVSLVRDDRGQPRYFISQIQDITGRRQNEENLRRQKAELRVLFDLMPAMLWFKDAGGRILRVNQRVADAAGMTVAAIEGKPTAEIYPLEAAKYQADDREVMLAGVPRLGIVETLRDAAGGETWVQTDKVPVRDQAGKVTGIVVLAQDITARRQSEAALRESEELFKQVVENIGEVFWVTDPATNRTLYVSPAYATIWGRSCASLCADPHALLESIHPLDLARVKEARATRLTRGDYDETFRILRPDGTVRWIHSRAYPVRDASGGVRRIVGVSEDITDYRTMEHQFRQAQKMEAMGTLAGGIAHDFNNILAAISGYTEFSRLILKDNPEVRAHLGAVLQAAGRATDLVRQILTFSRQQPLERRAIQLRPIVLETLALLRATIPTTIEFDLALATDAPTVLADASQIHQVLMNLGTNAWHAMRDRPGRLQVRLERFTVDAALAAAQPRLRPGDYARVSVGDTGCGMDRATQLRIFEPFFTTKAPGEGTGLGLSVVHGIMAGHDGAVTVYSQPGEGTVFHLYFPAHAGKEAHIGAEEEPVPRGHGERLLLVDDEESLAELGRQVLTTLGYEVVSTTKPEAALELVRAEPQRFALVLTDMSMPIMTGLALAAEVLKIRPGLPVILTTGYSASLTPDRVREAGLCPLLLKPTTLRTLATAVHAALSAASA